MNQRQRIDGSSHPGSRRDARLNAGGPKKPAAGWRINGFPARLLIWSPEEWEHLETRPIDAQYHPFGVWCALRLE